jgi:hypothetical protein
MSYLYTRLPPIRTVPMPAFYLKVIALPPCVEEVRSKLKPLYDKKDVRAVKAELDHVRQDK